MGVIPNQKTSDALVNIFYQQYGMAPILEIIKTQGYVVWSTDDGRFTYKYEIVLDSHSSSDKEASDEFWCFESDDDLLKWFKSHCVQFTSIN